MLAWTAAGSKLTMYSSSGQPVYQHSGPQAKAIENIYLAGSLVATREKPFAGGSLVTYQHTDALGSPVAESDQAGAVTKRMDYDPYGGPINHTFDGVGDTGHVMDPATGLTYMQQRYYDPAVGMFISVDPVNANSSNGNNFSRYWYSNNNPFRFTDPDGRESIEANFVEITDPETGQRIKVHRSYAVDAMLTHPSSPGADSVPEYRELTRAEVADGLDKVSAGTGLVSLVLLATPGAEPLAAVTGTVSAGASIAAALVEPTEDRWSAVLVSGFIAGAKFSAKGDGDTFEAATQSADAADKALAASREFAHDDKREDDE